MAIAWIDLDGLLDLTVIDQLCEEVDKLRRVMQNGGVSTTSHAYDWGLLKGAETGFPRNGIAETLKALNNRLEGMANPDGMPGSGYTVYFTDADWGLYTGPGNAAHGSVVLMHISDDIPDTELENPASWKAFIEKLRTVIDNLIYFHLEIFTTTGDNCLGAYLNMDANGAPKPPIEQEIAYSGPYVGDLEPANLSGDFDGEWIDAGDIETGYTVLGPGSVAAKNPGAWLRCGVLAGSGLVLDPWQDPVARWDAQVQAWCSRYTYNGADVDVDILDGWWSPLVVPTLTGDPIAYYHSQYGGDTGDDDLNYGSVPFSLRAALVANTPFPVLMDPFYNDETPFWEWIPDGTEDDDIPGSWAGDLLEMDGVTIPLTGYTWGDGATSYDAQLTVCVSGYHRGSDGMSPSSAIRYLFYIDANFTLNPTFRGRINK